MKRGSGQEASRNRPASDQCVDTAEMLHASAEPYFYAPDVFLKHEITGENAEGIQRLHMFRLGTVVMAGMAIGASDAVSIARLAASHGVTTEEHFCTWYNGQLHRGPTVCGMVLAALGCSPENAAEIVNRIWDLNGVPPAVRLGAIKQAYALGARLPGLRSRMQLRLTEPPPVD